MSRSVCRGLDVLRQDAFSRRQSRQRTAAVCPGNGQSTARAAPSIALSLLVRCRA
ncbi:Hypothetical protein A7982_04252 [Minicystis rosea]|nr:Hypothetical protein A7982_04252 [Minicystis rosea]